MFSARWPTADIVSEPVRIRGEAAFHIDHSANKQQHHIPRRSWNLRGPLLPRKRKFTDAGSTSEKCHFRTHATANKDLLDHLHRRVRAAIAARMANNAASTTRTGQVPTQP